GQTAKRTNEACSRSGHYPGGKVSHDTDGQMAERPMASDCKSDGLSPTGVRIPLCPVIRFPDYRLLNTRVRVELAIRPFCNHGLACGCSSMVELLPSKQVTRVRFPSPALDKEKRLNKRCCSSGVERVLGKDEVLGSIPSSSFGFARDWSQPV